MHACINLVELGRGSHARLLRAAACPWAGLPCDALCLSLWLQPELALPTQCQGTSAVLEPDGQA